MKNTVTLLLAVLLTGSLTAQNFQGKATYKSKRKVDIKLDSTQANPEIQSKMIEMLKKQFEKTYTLAFNPNESIYKEDVKLGAPQNSGIEVMMVNSDGSDILYKNTKENRFTNQNDVFGKIFLIKDTLEKLDWKLENETRNIGEYTCYKASLKREVEDIENSISFNRDNDSKEENTTPKMKTITITAWYTLEIPVSNGPGNFHGLPGLILSVNDGSETIVCSKIVLNPKNKTTFSEPSKGKVVTQEKFESILEKKMKEMEERYSPDSRGGETIEIRIGG